MLLKVAFDSIQYGLTHHHPLTLSPSDFPERLQAKAATFVTLMTSSQGTRTDHSGDSRQRAIKRELCTNQAKALRGCIGSLSAHQALVTDVCEHAHAAAFEDPRFDPLRPDELPNLDIEVSVLTEPQALDVAPTNEEELIAQVRPGRDGLILRSGRRSATFLPSVWESLPDPKDFLRELKRKAGFNPAEWPRDLQVSRYTTISFHSSAQSFIRRL